ncbi:DUF1360 domain-containing protein [Candidatus Kaiserbacteria bacterium]|nr:DUF1360 domain-containing protein [Candidatus Kaiserbacteria bacterium]
MAFHFWYTALSIFFIALMAAGYLWLADTGRLFASVPPTDFFLMALAVMRLVRLFTYDIITAFIRDWFKGADPRSLSGALGGLLNCPWCTGLWFAPVVVFFYFATPVAWYAILVLALSASATFLQLLANLAGWSAELKKKQAQ